MDDRAKLSGINSGKSSRPAWGSRRGRKDHCPEVATGQARQALSGEDGGYVLAELPAGNYVVTAEAGGADPEHPECRCERGSGHHSGLRFVHDRAEKRRGDRNQLRTAGGRYARCAWRSG